jgi:hypothetical protein
LGLYYLEYSEGIEQGTVPDVPEPATLGLLALGGLAVVRRRGAA